MRKSRTAQDTSGCADHNSYALVYSRENRPDHGMILNINAMRSTLNPVDAGKWF